MPRDLSYETHLGPKTKTEKNATLGRGVRGAEPPDKKNLIIRFVGYTISYLKSYVSKSYG